MKRIFSSAALLLLFTFATPHVLAVEQNNKFGIHIFSEEDLDDAAKLVNSSGGQWGYVTVVIREDERNLARWQSAFDKMRRLKLIPIVRIATTIDGAHWKIPEKDEAEKWALFMDSLNWPTKRRHIVLFNEPNHSKEWGGKIDPEGYAEVLRHYYNTLKGVSNDFFILPGALDLAAPNSIQTMEASRFFSRMHQRDNFIFTIFDGWSSHSYPNPAFSGREVDAGKMSIQGYRWEVNYLKDFGLDPEIPVFITETGWINTVGNLSSKYEYAFNKVWSDDQVVAVTPFILNYLDQPFEVFSWKSHASGDFLPHYNKVIDIQKVKGAPEQTHAFETIGDTFSEYVVSDSEYIFYVEIKNTGQSIFDSSDGFEIRAETTLGPGSINPTEMVGVEPGATTRVPIGVSTHDQLRGVHTISLFLYHNEERIGEILKTRLTLVSPPSARFIANFWFTKKQLDAVTISITDDDGQVARFDNLVYSDGVLVIPAIYNVIPNKVYKFTLERPMYISKSKTSALHPGETSIDFGVILPFDLDGDGALGAKDIWEHFKSPNTTSFRLLPS